MATIEWKYNYKTGLPGASTYYKGGSSAGGVAQQLEHFVTDHLNRSRGKIVKDLKKIEQAAKNEVKSRSRVRTGTMRRLVFSTGDYGTDILKVQFGWRELEPYYAPFQEFGTRNGIVPMEAVYQAFQHAVADLGRIGR